MVFGFLNSYKFKKNPKTQFFYSQEEIVLNPFLGDRFHGKIRYYNIKIYKESKLSLALLYLIKNVKLI